MPVTERNTISTPNLGLYLGRSHNAIPRRGLVDCLNVRIKLGQIQFDTMGWAKFPDDNNAVNLDNRPVTLIDEFNKRDGTKKTVFGNTTDLFQYDDNAKTIAYITPTYNTGTVDVTNGSATVSGTGTSWNSELKAGDYFHAGNNNQTDPTATWYEIASVDSDTQITLTSNYQEATQNGINYTARLTFTGDIKDWFSTETFYNVAGAGGGSSTGDRWYATNGVDAIVAWDGDDDQVYLPGFGDIDTARFIVRHKNRLVFVAPTVSGSFESVRIRTSNTGEPENVTSGEAASLIVKDGADDLLAAYPLGEQLALYAENQVIMAQYVGTPLIYAFQTAVTGFGPYSGRAVTVHPDFHDFVGQDTQYRFDGATVQEINDHVWRDIIRRTTPERREFLHSTFDDRNGETLWVVPLTTDTDANSATEAPEQAYVNHYMEQTGRDPNPFTRRELPALVFGNYERQDSLRWSDVQQEWEEYNYRWNDSFFFAQFPLKLFGDENGNIFILNAGTAKDGTTMNAYARFARRPVGDIETRSVIRRVYPFIEQMSGSDKTVNVKVYGTNTIEGKVSLLRDQNFNIGISGTTHFTSPRVSARYVEVQIGTEGTRHYWALNGYALDTVPGAKR